MFTLCLLGDVHLMNNDLATAGSLEDQLMLMCDYQVRKKTLIYAPFICRVRCRRNDNWCLSAVLNPSGEAADTQLRELALGHTRGNKSAVGILQQRVRAHETNSGHFQRQRKRTTLHHYNRPYSSSFLYGVHGTRSTPRRWVEAKLKTIASVQLYMTKIGRGSGAQGTR